MLADAALKSMNVLFTTPCYVSNVTMNYVTSCFDLIRESTRRGLSFNTHLHSESLVTRARNEIVKFFLANEKGDLIIARLSPKGYEEISRAHLIEATDPMAGRDVVWSHPAFANKRVYMRNDKEIICVDLANK